MIKSQSMVPKLSIILIGYNSLKFLKPCLEGVHAQTLKGIETLFIDNASADGSVAFVRKNFPWATVIANDQNLGYVGAANQGIRLTKAPYVMILNPDLILTPDYLKKILEKLQKDKKIGVITGKVLKYDFEKNRPTSAIDTTGLYCFRNRRIIDRGQGGEDVGQYDDEEEVFGVSGAVPVYRRTALEDVKLPSFLKPPSPPDEYLDEDFFMYKEDIDVSWRLRLRGWKCYYLPQAVCYHGRGTGVLKRFSNWEVYKSRKHLNRFQKYYAYKNQRLMQVKNERWGNLLHDAPPILWKELVILGYIMVREPYLLKSLAHFFVQFPRALRKRRLIMARRKVGAREMNHWLSGKARA
jgi:GT2 family glycosyltransferase